MFEQPDVFLIMQPQVNLPELARFGEKYEVDTDSTATTPGDYIPEFAGRLCYWSYNNRRPGGNDKYLENIKQQRHGSVTEHSVYGFVFTGVSRSLSHELVRHRAGWSYSQLSQRYVTDPMFVCHPTIAEDDRTMIEFENMIRQAKNNYYNLLEMLESKGYSKKVAREAAREILPNATETRIYATANVRAIRHFIELRGNPAADKQIQLLAEKIRCIMQEVAPNLLSDYSADGETKFPKI